VRGLRRAARSSFGAIAQGGGGLEVADASCDGGIASAARGNARGVACAGDRSRNRLVRGVFQPRTGWGRCVPRISFERRFPSHPVSASPSFFRLGESDLRAKRFFPSAGARGGFH